MINLHIGRQTFDFHCGAKALQTVMAYYGVYVREDDLLKELGTHHNGTSVVSMKSVAMSKGFQVKANDGWSLQDIKRSVDAGQLVIVLLQASAERYMGLEDQRKVRALWGGFAGEGACKTDRRAHGLKA
jgi:predicted double-glycine peptidase